ncbi:DUF418 domain-containing protein [Aliikangiella sp. IMCC44359]|uniref:DUF418 domain-containing protein n=1 Tax=Aliikangiella sp. IMCC44359 TaxID=3459125 RepID=UPI00403A8148
MKTNTIKPIQPRDRLAQLDIIRGFCLCGILFANLVSFTGFYSLSLIEIQQLPFVDRATLFLIDWLVEGKFYAMFSILFGVGFALQHQKFSNIDRNEIQTSFKNFWIRRMLALLLFGLLHIFFIWHGDILTLYSLLGLLLLSFSSLNQQNLRRWIYFLFSLPIVIHLILYLSNTHWFWSSFSQIVSELKTSLGYSNQTLLELRTSNRVQDVFFANIMSAIPRPMSYLQTGRIPEVLAYFLTGIYLAQQYLIQTHHKDSLLQLPGNRTLLKYLVSGLIMSFGYAYIKAITGSPFSTSLLGVFQGVLYHIGAIFIALALLGYLFKPSQLSHSILKPLAVLGRCSLSNYLAQTSLCVILFYGYGLALMGQVAFTTILGFAVAILTIQYYVSAYWLKHFSQGPLELIWRKMAYTEHQHSPLHSSKNRRTSPLKGQ